MIRLFVDSPLGPDAQIPLGTEQTHYLVKVMRQPLGARISLFNGADGEWVADLIEVGKRSARLQAVERLRAQGPRSDLELVVAVVKRTRLETIIEKAAELGVGRVRLALTERTNAERVRLDRLSAIAIEAAEQTGRLDVPEVTAPMKLGLLLDSWPAGRRLLFCDEAGEALPVFQALSSLEASSWTVLIGPEGGFSAAERNHLRSAPFVTTATLGPRILRADTAAISALTLLQAAAGDWRQ